jgi:triosephosphate isomerase
VPEVAKSFGASGSILNHSEHQLDMETISELVQRLRDLQMTSVVCAASVTEVKRIADIGPDYIAIEPPELIGTGKAVSKEDPAIITNSVRSIQGSNSLVICGAGITHKNDVSKAMELGSNGILVASGIVKASSWYDKIYELASGMV